MYYLFPIVLRWVISRKEDQVKIYTVKMYTVKTPTVFIDPGMVCLKMALSHWASVQPNSTHAFADGTTLTRRPSMVSFKADQPAAHG